MISLAYIERYTVEDWKIWEGDWELIDGQPYSMAPSPIYDHQFVLTRFIFQFYDLLKDCPNCNVTQEIDWHIANDTVVRPDLSLFCYEPEDFLYEAPKIVVEVVSKSTRKRDEIVKKELYFEEGVEYYIIAYPNIKKAKVYKTSEDGFLDEGYQSRDIYTFEIDGCELEFDFSKVWKK